MSIFIEYKVNKNEFHYYKDYSDDELDGRDNEDNEAEVLQLPPGLEEEIQESKLPAEMFFTEAESDIFAFNRFQFTFVVFAFTLHVRRSRVYVQTHCARSRCHFF